MDLTGLSKDELLAELKRREEEEKKAEILTRKKRWDCVLMNLGDFLEWMEHERASCNDNNLNNSWLHPNGYPACRRCFILIQLEFKENAESLAREYDIKIELVIQGKES